MEQELLRKLQLTELQILKDVDLFCQNNKIHYSLYSGTALGAVRHGGFIPWDDDIDIVMIRSEYDRFCTLFLKEPIEGYTIENIETDERCEVNHTKIRKDDTVLIARGENENDGRPHGVWIDLFAWDKVSRKERNNILFYIQTARLFFYTRANGLHTEESLGRRLGRGVFRLLPKSLRIRGQRRSMHWLRKHDCQLMDDYQWTSTSSFGGLGLRMDSILPECLQMIKFEDGEFPIFEDYDTYLKAGYGEYMQLPPSEKRIYAHNPKKIIL